MFGKLLIWVFLAVACSVLIKIMLLLDLNKKIYNHQPGICQYVKGIEAGSEDMELLEDGTVFISSGLRYIPGIKEQANVKGAIFVYDINAKEGQGKYRATKLTIDHGTTLDLDTFNPHGISTYVSKGRVTLYVVNHRPDGDVIEALTYNKQSKTLTHTKTISNSLFYSLNDLIVVGADKFYVTNDHYFGNHWLRVAEDLLMLNLGNVVYYDGKAWAVDSWMVSPNGIGTSKDKQHLYVASPLSESIRLYNISRDSSLTKVADMTLLTSPDNIFVDKETGELWIGSHPIAHEIFAHLNAPKSTTAPSQVLHIRIQGAHDRWVVTEPYANDGKTGSNPLHGSTIAVHKKGELLVGTIHHKMLHCGILNPDLA